MHKDVILLAYELNDAIKRSKAFQELRFVENEIQNDQALLALEKHFIEAQERLIFLEEKGTEEEKKVARNALSIAKYALDTHPLTIKYQQALKELNQIYGKINTSLFTKFRKQKSCKI